MKFRLSPLVYCNAHEEDTCLLDFSKGQFFALDGIGFEMLTGILTVGVEATCQSLAATYAVEPDRLESDLQILIKELIDHQLIVPVEKHSSKKNTVGLKLSSILTQILKIKLWIIRKLINPDPDPNGLTINGLLLLSWLSFRFLDWGTTLKLWQRWHPQELQTNLKPDETQEILTQVDRRIRENAAASFFFPMVCKERALVGYHLLRVFYRLPVQLVIGTALYPLQLHAWVEYEGQIITDDPEHCAYFDPIVTYPDATSV